MRNFGFTLAFLLLCGVVLIGIGCRSNGQQPSNPFAANRQTAPPPATFSSQAAYLGQTPSIYIPQTPATVYPGTPTPLTNPVGAPLPSSPVPATTAPGSTVPGGSLGSIQPSGASVYQTAVVPAPVSAIPVEKTANLWTPASESEWDGQSAVPITETRQTAFQNLESKTHTIAMVSSGGSPMAEIIQPEKLAVSSSQTVTKIIEE